jgi:hypothetical protein
VAHKLNLRGAQILGDRFDTEDHEQGKEENGLNVVKACGQERVQVNDVIGEGNFPERKFRADDGRIKHIIYGRLDH